MAVRVRLTRVGSRKNPIWRVVVADQRSPRDGRILETVGRYNPQRQPSEIVLDRERIDHWVAHGAQVSETVRGLLRAVERDAPPERAAASGRGNGASAPPAATAPDESATPEPEDATDAGATGGDESDDASPADGSTEEGSGEDASVADAAPADAAGDVDEEASEDATAAGGG